jgi:hypothetical protein
MKRHAAARIEANVRDEFAGILADAERHLKPGVSIDHARELLAAHLPTLVVGRAELLLDTLLNYLVEDATESLSHAPTEVKNEFYALDLRARIKGSYSLEPQTLQFSYDPRIVAGGCAAGGTLLAGGLLISLVLTGVVGKVIAGLATLVASAAAFRVAHSAATETARRRLGADVLEYLEKSESQAREWLEDVERSFEEAFEAFASSYGGRKGDA